MQVERCPSCGARYNVSRLRSGTAFACRRCGAKVRVGGGASPEAPARVGGVGLVVAGLLMVAALFLYANPSFGVKAARWPWEHWSTSGSLARQTDIVLWVLVAALGLAVGLGAAGRRAAGVLLALALFLAVRCYSQSAAFRIDKLRLSWMLAATFLGAGAALVAPRRGEGGAPARALLACGALGIVAIYAAYVAPDGHWGFEYIRGEFRGFWEAVRGDGADRDKAWEALWTRVLPMTFQIASVVLALMLAALPRGAPPGVRRPLAVVCFACLLLTWVESLGAQVWQGWDRVKGPGGVHEGAQIVGATVLDGGLALWLIASFALVAASRARAHARAGFAADEALA